MRICEYVNMEGTLMELLRMINSYHLLCPSFIYFVKAPPPSPEWLQIAMLPWGYHGAMRDDECQPLLLLVLDTNSAMIHLESAFK